MNSILLKAGSFFSEFACIAPVVTLYLLDLGITLSQVLMAQVFYSLGVVIAEIPTGVFADTFGRRRSIIVGHGISLLCIIGFLIIPGAGFLYALTFLQGVGGGFLSGSAEALLFESGRSTEIDAASYSKSLASLLSYGTLGFVLATAISGIVISLAVSDVYYWLIGITAASQALSFVLSFGLKESVTTSSPQRMYARMRDSFKTLKSGIYAVYCSATATYLALCALLTNCGEYFLREMYQPLFAKASIPSTSFGLVLSIGALLNFFILRNSFKLERYLTLPQMLFALYAIIAGGYFILSYSSSQSLLIAVAIGIFGLLNTEKPIVSEYVNTHISDAIRATALSTVSLAGSLGTIFSRITLSFILDSSGLIAGFIAQGAMLLVGACVVFWAMSQCDCIRRGESSSDSRK
jgi:MFS family permease